ncbi:KRAB [Lepeophtheirus salmonis]|uniref:KRAB n=1 Tax=Lepeophtheirus salmonis TaxID=72036 RepID=A0A7R8CZY4_LEPSM|nr:KRAB [Lepeophtheirus salmonis]CAF2978954.1 KRAB [Lepeophtheirus salmonis]
MGSLLDIRDNLVSRYSSLGSWTVKLLSYHGNVLKEEKLDGGQILDCLNEGKLFMCLGIGNQTLNDSLLKDVYSEPSKGEGEIAFRSRQCSFFLENTPGLCNECQSLLTTLYSMEYNFDNDTLDNDWSFSELKEEDESFDDNTMTLNECSKCLKTFNNTSSLNRHKRRCLNDTVDNEEKSGFKEEDKVLFEENISLNECSKCLKIFNNTSSLNRHERSCLKDPDFAKNNKICHLRHSNLHVERMNLNEGIHCPLCGHSLDNRRLLNAHIHESHDASKGCCGELKNPLFVNRLKPYKCSRCEYCCLKKSNLYIHLRRVHKMTPTSNDVITIAEQIKLSWIF